MVFSTLFFVFVFFVLSYIAQAVFPDIRRKNIALLVSSLIFYAWGGPLLILLLCGMTFICWLGALCVEDRTDKREKKICLTVTAVLVLGLLGFFKYTGFLVDNINGIFNTALEVNVVLPIGISFYTFQLLSYVVDVYRGEVVAQQKYWLLLLYASLFHQCIAGPIVRYSDVNEEILDRRPTVDEVSRGVTRFAVGLAKKAVLANGVAVIADTLLPCTVNADLIKWDAVEEFLTNQSALGLLLGGLAYMLQIYFDFSAYSDMAIGMGLMIGFHYKENFNYPYAADSVSDFWRRWHISLSSFFRDYVYIPLGGNRCSVGRQIFNLFVVWFLTGMWHGASWNYILWGLFFLVFLLLEKFVLRLPKKPQSAGGAAMRHIYSLIVVYFGWFLFRFEDMKLLGIVLKGIFCGNGNPFTDIQTGLIFKNNIFLLIFSLIACTPAVKILTEKFSERPHSPAVRTAADVVSVAVPAVCVFISVLMLIGNSYNPFLYFQF